MTFLDLFAGIGGFRRGMELAGHECVGWCESDKFARASYLSMHCLSEEERAGLKGKTIHARMKEVLEIGSREWVSDDIRRLLPVDIPKADCWCFGAPCKSFSREGRKTGLNGESGLVQEVFRLLEGNRPEWLVYENVKGMFTTTGGFDFLGILCEMDRLGYDVEWQVLNTRDFGVPQNRERVFTVGHCRDYGRRKVLPISGGVREADNRHGQCLRVREGTKKGYSLAFKGDSINMAYPTSVERRGRVGKGEANTITCERKQAYVESVDPVKVRWLTARECFRLQGWSDEYYDRARLVCSETQLYKQAGNGVSVPVVREIGNGMS